MGLVQKGIKLYNIGVDGLYGFLTNEYLNGDLLDDIAKLRPGTKVGKDKISGTYDCYFEEDCKILPSGLSITLELRNGVYEYISSDEDGNLMFKGFGYRMNLSQIVIHFWSIGD